MSVYTGDYIFIISVVAFFLIVGGIIWLGARRLH